MEEKKSSDGDRYLTDLLLPDDPALDEALDASAAAHLPSVPVSPPQGKLLQLLAQIRGTRRILEIGTLGGYSTLSLAKALPEGGRLISLELDPRHAEVARENISNAGLDEVVEVREGPASESLPQLAAEHAEPFDLIFIDADKPAYPEYLSWALRLSRRGSVIVADNVVRSGAVADAESLDPNVQGIRKFHEMLSAESRVSATAIGTVGRTGYDGFALAFVTQDPSPVPTAPAAPAPSPATRTGSGTARRSS
jgi:predicted O-methyltransferase YrrM